MPNLISNMAQAKMNTLTMCNPFASAALIMKNMTNKPLFATTFADVPLTGYCSIVCEALSNVKDNI